MALEGIDKSLMYGFNRAVQLHNYITGGTKRDLADLTLLTGTVLGETGFIDIATEKFYEGNLESGLLNAGAAIITLLYSAGLLIINRRLENLENRAKQMNLEDRDVEDAKMFRKIVSGPFFSLTSISIILSNKTLQEKLYGGMFGFIAASDYIMRTDPLPPRKNIVKRTLESILRRPARAYAGK
jgi:hypothetical protein